MNRRTGVERPQALRVVIYTRVSRDDTGEGESNARQEEACRQLAQMRGWEVVAVEKDISISAYTGAERPGWNRVLERMSSGDVDVVLAWKLDRVTRTVAGLVDIIMLSRETGVLFATTDGMLDLTTPTGKAVATILAAVAEMEVELKGERQRLANKKRAAEGLPWKSGWGALGYTRSGEVIEDQAAHVRQAAEDVLNGASLKSIARRWNDEGVTTDRNKQGKNGWTHNGVRSVLLNPRYAGYATYKGEIVGRGKWEPILTEDTHALLVARLTDKGRDTNGNRRAGRQPSNLLSGIGTCADCGEPVTGGTRSKQVQENGKRRTVGRVQVYKCPNEHLSTDRAEVDALVRRAFAAAAQMTLPGTVMSIPAKGEAPDLHEERKKLTDRLTELGGAFGRGAMSMEQVEAATAAINEQLADLDEREAALDAAAEYDPSGLRSEQVRNFLNLDTDGQRDVLKRLAVITLHRKGKGRKNVPISDQLDMQVKQTYPSGKVRLIPAFKRGDSVPYTPSETHSEPV